MKVSTSGPLAGRLGPSLQVCLESYFQLLARLETIRQRLLLELKELCEKAVSWTPETLRQRIVYDWEMTS